MNEKAEGLVTDHINGNRLDNRRKNLRHCTSSENNKNRFKGRTNTSGALGVSWSNARQKWIAQICFEKKAIYLGGFKKKEDAILARKIKAEKLSNFYNH